MIIRKVLAGKGKVPSYKLEDETRRLFSGSESVNGYRAYILLLELKSHKDGFNTSQKFIMNKLNWKHTSWYTKALGVLLDEGYAFISGDNRNQTLTVYELPLGENARYVKKSKLIKEEPVIEAPKAKSCDEEFSPPKKEFLDNANIGVYKLEK